MGSIRTRTDSGKLFFDFRVAGVRCREQTELDNSAANLKRLDSVLHRIEYEMSIGTFDYRRYFPNSTNIALVDAALAKTTQTRNPSSADSAQQTSQPLATANSQAVVSSESPLLSDFAETWYDENAVRWRRTTCGLMRSYLDRHLIPAFGAKTVGSISRPAILEFRAGLAKLNGKVKGETISPKTVNDIVGMLKAVLDEAADRYGFVSPCQRVKRLKVPRKDIKPFTLDETLKIIAEVRADFRDYFTVRFFNGMRTGEANGLKWCHVDFERRQILVRETFTHGEQDQTKTDGSQREVVMSQPIFEALKRMQACTGEQGGYVFCNRAGLPLDNKNFCVRVWYPLLKRMGLARRRPYQMRHTCATLWLAAGENPEWIAKQFGHSTTEMLFRVYSRFVPNLTRKDGSAFNRLLNGAMTAPVSTNGTETPRAEAAAATSISAASDLSTLSRAQLEAMVRALRTASKEDSHVS